MAISVPVKLALGADVANSGTLVLAAYPTGTTQATFTGGNASATGMVIINNNDEWTEAASKISIVYGSSTITITNSSGSTWPAGASVIVGLSHAGSEGTGPITAAPVTNLGGTLTGTTTGTMANIAAIALSTSNTYTDAAVNTAVNAAVTALNLQLKELQTKVNSLLTSLRNANAIGQ